jgi:acetyl esterase/lipase
MHYYYLADELRQQMNSTVAVMNYRLVQHGFVQDMVQDVGNAIALLKLQFSSSKIIVIGHSAGAHLVSYTISKKYLSSSDNDLRWSLNDINGMILCSGVYDIMDHYTFECGRGVEKWSGMEKSMRGITNFAAHSPLRFFQNKKVNLNETTKSFVKTILFHGNEDETVPVHQSTHFHEALQRYFTDTPSISKNIQLQLIPKVNHSDYVLSLMNVASRVHHRDLILKYLESGIASFDSI